MYSKTGKFFVKVLHVLNGHNNREANRWALFWNSYKMEAIDILSTQ
jgi:hypothetical protein